MKLNSAILTTLLVGLFALAPVLVKAEESETLARNISVKSSNGALYVSFQYKEVVTPAIEKKLKSGLPTRIVLQLNLEQNEDSTPISYYARSATIVYDLWEEIFVVTIEDDRGKRQTKVKTEKEAIDLSTVLVDCKVASFGDNVDGLYRVHALIEVNPVSKEMIENIRKWLSRPFVKKNEIGQQTNYFGSFVGIFVDRRIGEADKSMSFVSQWFEFRKQ